MVGGRTRAARSREKTRVLRSIKDVEFEHARGKVSDRDFVEMGARLRARAAGLMRQLDEGSTYRQAIEAEIAKRIGAPANARPATTVAPTDAVARTLSGPPVAAGLCASCGKTNAADARFCSNCGRKLAVSQ